MKHQGLDHLAIVVKDTEEALQIWHHGMGLPLVHSEVVNDGTIRLTHLDLGNTHLQLVQPLTPDHPLQDWLKENKSGLHHFCLKVENVSESKVTAPFFVQENHIRAFKASAPSLWTKRLQIMFKLS
jgi:methylmalonyl-CoA/ethylmalonyl-CoA epimerase